MKAIWIEMNIPRMGLARMGRALGVPSTCWGPLSSFHYGERPAPDLPGDRWVRCRTVLGGICGSDIHTVLLRQPIDSICRRHVSYPMFLGHENLAEVAEVGPAVDRSWVGRRVCVEPTLSCRVRGIDPPCRPCAGGHIAACENVTLATDSLPPGIHIGYNSRTGGAWSEQFVAHEAQLFPVPDSVPNEWAILTDPMACALHAALRARPADDHHVLIVGAGVIGLGLVAALRAIGCRCRITIDARHDFQRVAARRLGADEAASTGRPGSAHRFDRLAELCGCRVLKGMVRARTLAGGFDVTYDCVGAPATIQDALRSTRGGGRVVLVGTSTAAARVDWTAVWFRELEVLGVNGRRIESWNGGLANSYRVVLDLMAAGKLKPEGLLTHRFPLAEFGRAFATVMDKRTNKLVKAAFTFGD